MRHRKRRVIEGRWFNLNSVTSPATGRKHYEISVNAYSLMKEMPMGELSAMRDHFDPAGNRGSKFSTKWKYRDKVTAETLLTMAILKWGA